MKVGERQTTKCTLLHINLLNTFNTQGLSMVNTKMVHGLLFVPSKISQKFIHHRSIITNKGLKLCLPVNEVKGLGFELSGTMHVS